MSTTRLSIAPAALAACLLSLAACQPAMKPPPPGGAGAADSASADAPPSAIQHKPLTDPVTAKELVPAKDIQAKVAYTQGKDHGKSFAYSVKKTQDGWVRTIADHSVVYLKLHDDGSIVVTREDDLVEKVTVTYDPYVVVVPAKLAKTMKVAGEAKTQVVTISDGSPRGSGTTTYSITSAWQADVKCADGSVFDAHMIRDEREMKLDIATVKITIDSAFAKGQGLVAETVWKQQTALGLFGSHDQWQFTRASGGSDK